jgi:MYXO-CTERM domain-containing protein
VTRARQLGLVLATGIGLLACASALAYVRSRTTKSNQPLSWVYSCAYVAPIAAGTTDLSIDDVITVMKASAYTWSSTGCSYFQIIVDPPEPSGIAKLDHPVGRNLVIFRGNGTDDWCPHDSSQPCYDRNATALTTVFYVDKPGTTNDGVILDADIEINNRYFAFTADGSRPPDSAGRVVADLENTLTHEFGHVLGLDHTCYDGWNPCQNNKCKVNQLTCRSEIDCYPLDELGQHIPACSEGLITAKETDATMYNYANSGDTSKRSLSEDDVNGVCAMYPLTDKNAHLCVRVDTGSEPGCSVAAAAHARGGSFGLVLLSLTAAWRIRRSRRTSPAQGTSL